MLQHLLSSNFIQIAHSPESSPPSSPRSVTSSRSTAPIDYFVLDKDARDHFRNGLSIDEKVEQAWLACRVCTNGIKENDADSSTLQQVHTFGSIMLPHARACYDDWAGVLENPPDEVAWHVLGNVCMTQGALAQAIGCFELALRQDAGMETLQRIQTSISLSQLLEREGNSQKSLEILKSIDMESIDQALGFRVARARASATAACGELGRAEDQYKTLEHEQEQILGPTHAETVGTVQMLAATLERLEKLGDAQILYRRVYQSYQYTFGQGHPMTLGSLDDLANISKAVFATEDAENLYKQSIDIKTRYLGADHPRTAFAIQNLATMDDLRGRYSEAKQKYIKALEIMRPTIGPSHPHYTLTLKNLARSLHHHGQILGLDTPMSSSLGAADFTTRVTGFANARSPAARDGVMRETARRRALMESEQRYLEVLRSMKASRGIYSEEHVRAVAQELHQLYEDENIFALQRYEKIQELWALAGASPRRGTMS